MPATGPHTFPDVLVLIRREGGWVCEIAGRPVWIGELHIEPGTEVPAAGTRGPITIATFAVENVTRQLRGVFP